MKRVSYTLLFSLIMVAGLLIGMVKGQEVRNKWISKMKFKHEKKANKKQLPADEVQLDEIELSTYHS